MRLATLLLAWTALLAQPAWAQERRAIALEFAAGTLLFPDDGATIPEGFVGGAGRFYVSPRVSVGPEVAFINGDSHSHLMLTGNLTFDLLEPSPGRSTTVTPFLVVGGGLFRTREEFGFTDPSTHNEGAFTAGGGVRVRMKRVFVGAEARIGWETHIRVNGLIGVDLGR